MDGLGRAKQEKVRSRSDRETGLGHARAESVAGSQKPRPESSNGLNCDTWIPGFPPRIRSGVRPE